MNYLNDRNDRFAFLVDQRIENITRVLEKVFVYKEIVCKQ